MVTIFSGRCEPERSALLGVTREVGCPVPTTALVSRRRHDPTYIPGGRRRANPSVSWITIIRHGATSSVAGELDVEFVTVKLIERRQPVVVSQRRCKRIRT